MAGNGLPLDRSTEGVTAVASFAGRVCYAGAGSKLVEGDKRSPQYKGYVFVSQLISSIDNINKCYQEADPTSEHISDPIDTDGGFIVIQESGRIRKLVPMRFSLFVFAENGVWQIISPETGFTPTSFRVDNLGTAGVLGADSVVQTELGIFYWSNAGIYGVVPHEVTGEYTLQNVTENTIQTIYNNISTTAKKNARGVYDAAARQLRWLYNDSPTYDGVTDRFLYNRELIFDFKLGAFSTATLQELSGDTPYISSYIPVLDFVNADVVYNIVVGLDSVVVGANTVVTTDVVETNVDRAVKYFTSYPVTAGNYKYTISFYRDPDFKDWVASDSVGVDAPAYLLTGDITDGDTERKKQTTYLITHFNRTEDGFELDGNNQLQLSNVSSCLVQARWEWSDSSASGRWGTQFQAYRLKRNYIPSGVGDTFDYGFELITTKSKLRGQGKAVRIRFDTEPGKDCNILGWALTMTGGTKV